MKKFLKHLFWRTSANDYWNISRIIWYLTRFMPLISFDTPWKHQKTFGFQGVSKEISGMKWVNKFILPKMFAEFFVTFSTGFMWFWYLRRKPLLLKSCSCKWWNTMQWGQKTTDYLQSSEMRKLYRSTQRLWRLWKNELLQKRFICWMDEADLQKDM